MVAAEDAEGLARGTKLDYLPDGTVRAGSERAITPWRGGWAFVKLIPQKDLYRFVHDDLRVMPISFDGSGNGRITLAEAVAQMDDTEPAGGRGVSGPATAVWVVREMRDHSLSRTAHHEH